MEKRLDLTGFKEGILLEYEIGVHRKSEGGGRIIMRMASVELARSRHVLYHCVSILEKTQPIFDIPGLYTAVPR